MTRNNIEKKLFLGSSKNDNDISLSSRPAVETPINTPVKANASKNITTPVE